VGPGPAGGVMVVVVIVVVVVVVVAGLLILMVGPPLLQATANGTMARLVAMARKADRRMFRWFTSRPVPEIVQLSKIAKPIGPLHRQSHLGGINPLSSARSDEATS
jgi:hypothetical protein